MRLWPVDPSLLCRKHLLGEHVETHMMVSSLNRGKNLEGFYAGGLIDTRLIRVRHDLIASEMQRRGYTHKSPLPDYIDPQRGHLDPGAHENLRRRCEECAMLTADRRRDRMASEVKK